MLDKGRADVVINSDYDASPIAFHYSPASIKVNRMLELTQMNQEAVKGLRDILSMLDCDYDYIAYQQLEDNKLKLDKYKILVLPVSSALSEKEVEAVKMFVKNGGVLVGDLMAATYTNHGKNRDCSALDDIFGIKHNGAEIVHGEATVVGTAKDNTVDTGKLNMPVNYFENNITCIKGKPLAEISYKGKAFPALIANQYGKGYTLYLACDIMSTFSNWQSFAYAPQNKVNLQALKGIFANLLKRGTVESFAQPLVEDGSRLIASTCYLRKNGTVRILGIVRNNKVCVNIDDKPHDVTVKLQGKYYVYNLIDGQFLGHGDSFNYRTGPTTQSIFVLVPYKVNSPVVNLENTVSRGAELNIKVKINADTADLPLHTLNVTVFNPEGKKVDAYSDIYFATKGQCEFSIPIALNDMVGQWEIAINDVMTQTKTIKTFTVK